MGDIAERLLAILKRYPCPVEHDPEWVSPCQLGEADDDGMIKWQPVEMSPPANFSDVEEKLGLALHSDAKEFYGSWWAGPVYEFRHCGETLLLKTIWNLFELNSFKESLLDHIHACRAAGRSPTVFIGNTDSCCFFSVDNATGEVVLEEPGNPNRTCISPNLATFLEELCASHKVPEGQ